MDFQRLLTLVGDEPIFETGLLLAGEADPAMARVQLARWVRSGRVVALRRGLYTLAAPYRRAAPHPFVVANRLAAGSYVSLQAALAHYGLIPEYAAVTTSVGTGRPMQWSTPLGDYTLRHIAPDLLWGYARLELGAGQWAYVAQPEKALLDLAHLTPESDSREYLAELRLDWERLDLTRLDQYAERAARPKLKRVARLARELAQAAEEYVAL